MNENMITVTAENFEKEVEQSSLPVMLDFWAPWCVYCRRIEPAIEELLADAAGKLVIGKVNVDEQPRLAEQFGIETIPSLILFKEGDQAGEELIAPGSRDAIEEWLEDNGVVL